MTHESVATRLDAVVEAVTSAAERSGRRADEVAIIAVSKGVEPALIEEAIAAGQSDFGENRAQEAAAKYGELAAHSLSWHFVGRLQRNKVKLVADFVHMIHSVDRFELGQEIVKRSAGTPRVLIEVNTSGETAKGGVSADELPVLIDRLVSVNGLRVDGLMTMAPMLENPEAARPCFRLLARLRDDMQGKFPDAGIRHLSMGMSQDYAVAIEEGATMIRIGQAIFGPRLP